MSKTVRFDLPSMQLARRMRENSLANFKVIVVHYLVLLFHAVVFHLATMLYWWMKIYIISNEKGEGSGPRFEEREGASSAPDFDAYDAMHVMRPKNKMHTTTYIPGVWPSVDFDHRPAKWHLGLCFQRRGIYSRDWRRNDGSNSILNSALIECDREGRANKATGRILLCSSSSRRWIVDLCALRRFTTKECRQSYSHVCQPNWIVGSLYWHLV